MRAELVGREAERHREYAFKCAWDVCIIRMRTSACAESRQGRTKAMPSGPVRASSDCQCCGERRQMIALVAHVSRRVARTPHVSRLRCACASSGPSITDETSASVTNVERARTSMTDAEQDWRAVAGEAAGDAVLKRAAELGVPLRTLSPRGASVIAEKIAGTHATGETVVSILAQTGRARGTYNEERSLLISLSAAEQHESSSGQRILGKLDYLGTALFSAVGALLAGEAGMHVVGAALVGTVSAVGGGTVNNLCMGETRGGVFWVRDPTFLLVAVGAAAAAFYAWPVMEEAVAESDWRAPALFAMDSVALGAFAVIGAQGAMRRGLHPVVCCAAGVSICFGGILRDLLCGASRDPNHAGSHAAPCGIASLRRDNCLSVTGRSVALGSQSFALASLAGAGAYVGLTELSLRLGAANGRGLPLGVRITAGVCTTIAVRALAWQMKPNHLLPPMANYKKDDAQRRTELFHARSTGAPAVGVERRLVRTRSGGLVEPGAARPQGR